MPSPDCSRASALLVGAAAGGCSVVAALVMVLADDTRWLRLGVVAALWAALVGAFAAARYRREAAAGPERVEELRRIYQLELEREVAARREYELELEADLRRRIETELRDGPPGAADGVHAELRNLRESLQALLGGDVLVERVALRAESTRFRAVSDQSRVLGWDQAAIEPVAPAPSVPLPSAAVTSWPAEPNGTPPWDGGARTEVVWTPDGGHCGEPERESWPAESESESEPAGTPGRHRGRTQARASLPPWSGPATGALANGSSGNGSSGNGADGNGADEAVPADPADQPGAHGSGLSMSALLATYGSGGSGGRRRRTD